ncbi:hypothetical protein PT274_03730 [Leuconostocaceae bacterium ESL0958]|nr:hypothetical protein [Leuconostocaceae bacterium ESL0958]
MKGRLAAFTMVEALFALGLAALVFEACTLVLPKGQHFLRTSPQVSLSAACTQLARQDYRLVRASTQALYLTRSGQFFTLKQERQRLVLRGPSHGQIFFMTGVQTLQVQDKGIYQEIKLQTVAGQKQSALLFLLPAVETQED